MTDKPATSPLKKNIDSRVAAIHDRERKALQLKMFPDWPDDRRGAPNTLIRSAVFGVVRRGRRKRVADLPLASPEGSSITLTGWRLDQYDCDIWLEVMHLARNTTPGDEVRFKIHSMLKRIGHTSIGQTDYTWLIQRLKHLTETSVTTAGERKTKGLGGFIAAFEVDETTGEGVVSTNPRMRPFFESVTHLDIEQRRALGSNQLAKALHALLASHVDWIPMRLETVMNRVGADYGRLRDFKRDLRAVLDDFTARGWIRDYRFTAGADGELLAIAKVRTPAQERLADRRRVTGGNTPEPET